MKVFKDPLVRSKFIIAILIGWLLFTGPFNNLFSSATASGASTEMKVKPVLFEVSEGLAETWEDRRVSLLGDRIGQTYQDTLKVTYAHPIENATVVSFIGERKGDRVFLSCDSRTNVTELAYNFKLLKGINPADVIGFSIRHYKEGTTAIYTADQFREPLFSTERGDVYLKQALEIIQELPPEDLIGFTVDISQNETPNNVGGWSPLFKVRDVAQAVSQLNLSDCDQVYLVGGPDKMS
jgi:hypothetical protein